MTAPLNTHAFTLMSLLNNAISTCETDNILFCQNATFEDNDAQNMITHMYITNRDIDPDTTNWEDQYTNILEIMKRQTHNLVICKLYDYGKDLRTTGKKIRKTNKDQTNAVFIFDYFRGTPKAIEFLQDVTLHDLNTLRASDRKTILSIRQAIVKNQEVIGQGPTNLETDDLWHSEVPDDAVEDLFTAEPPSKRPRHESNHRSATPTATDIFGCDVTEFGHLIPPDLTIDLEPFPESVRSDLKRKFE